MDPFAALADPVRRALLVRLREGAARVVDLSAGQDVELAVSRPAVSRHLRVLAEAGLVAAEDRGRERHYRLLPAGLEPVERLLVELRGAAAAPPIPTRALDGLDLEVRRTVRDHRAERPAPTEQQGDTA